MIDPRVLEKHGGTPELLRPKFETDKKNEKIKALIEQSRDRIDEGLTQCGQDARFWWAIDRAFDVSQRQVTYTLVEGLIDANLKDDESVLNAATSLGLSNMLCDKVDPKTGSTYIDPRTRKPVKCLDLPTFFQIYVPVVAAYVKIRWAKLFNDRNIFPFYRYEPSRLTVKSRLKSDIITDRIQRQAQQMGYVADERQSILQMILHGKCLNFPMEAWYTEKQKILDEDEKEKEVIVKEGVRFAIPHPSRCFHDLAHRPSTLNTDTGCEYSGYWDVIRFKDIKNNNKFWNRDKITFGGSDFWFTTRTWDLYTKMYPCVMKFPSISSGQGAGDQDRIERAFAYGTTHEESAVNIVPYFVKLNPKEHGLFDYDYPLWMRLVFASHDTVIWAEPLAYNPNVAYLYDADQNRAFNSSMGLELIPWQDHIGNYLTQYLLSIKKNLAKIVFYNSDFLEEKDVSIIRNLGEKLYRDYTMIPVSERELGWQQATPKNAFWPVEFPQLNTAEIGNAITTMLGIMERMLGFSSQELGAPAVHEQSATEVSVIQQNTSVRLDFIGSQIDEAIHARKNLLYDAMMAYSDDEILAEVANMNNLKREALDEMGFKVEEESAAGGTRAGVRGDKKSLVMDGFTSSREGKDRIPDSKVATAMLQAFQTVFSSPPIVEKLGVDKLIEMYNQILVHAGLPKDFKITTESDGSGSSGQQQQIEAILQQLAQLKDAIVQEAAQESKKIIDSELGQFADAVKKTVSEPMEQKHAQIENTLSEMVQKMTQSDETDARQDDALSSILRIMNASQTEPQLPVT